LTPPEPWRRPHIIDAETEHERQAMMAKFAADDRAAGFRSLFVVVNRNRTPGAETAENG